VTVAIEQQARLSEEYASTSYVFLGQLAMAKAYNDQGDANAAAEALREAVDLAPTPLLETLAGLRLARVLVAAQDYAAAKAVIDQHDRGSSYAADFAALRGDIALAEGRIDDARVAYEQALTDNAAAGLIRLKLQNLPAPTES
jgi:predicted negative regulator of RcsB-dependent stress response